MRRVVWAALAAVTMIAPQPAWAEDVYDGLVFEQLKAALATIPGLTLNEKSTDKGNRYFETTAAGGTVSFLATMASCPDDRRGSCDGIAYLHIDAERPMTAEVMANFNREVRFVKAKPSTTNKSSVIAGEFFARGVGTAFVKTSCAYYVEVLEAALGGSSLTTMNGQGASPVVSFAGPDSADKFFATLAQRRPQKVTATGFDDAMVDAINGRKR